MKRKALLIGDTRDLDTVSIKDIDNITNFLKSDEGGAWYDSEIVPLIDKKADDLFKLLEAVKDEANDFVIVYFTGHGGTRGNTILEINPIHDYLESGSFQNLATRQINIFDCCRYEVPDPIEVCVGVGKKKRKAFGDIKTEKIRLEYEELVMNACPQTVCLYSCSKGEGSSFNANGSYFTQCLIDSAKSLLTAKDVVRIYDCHARASSATADMAFKERGRQQHPEIEPAKCLYAQELPISFNPKSTNS